MALTALVLHFGLLVGSKLHGVGRSSRAIRTDGVFMAKAKAKPAATGGFGAPKAPPPTLDDVCASFPTRLPEDTSVCCPCGTGDTYEKCCRPYHIGDAVAETPERCLRTRYSGFCYRLPKYIIKSTAKSNRDWSANKVKWARKLHREQMFDSFKFVQLEVLEEEERGESEREAFLSMRVTLQPIDERTRLPTQAEPMVFAERSTFTRSSKGAWLYAAGAVTSEVSGLKDRVLNDESDLGTLEKDVGWVRGILNEDKKDPEAVAKYNAAVSKLQERA